MRQVRCAVLAMLAVLAACADATGPTPPLQNSARVAAAAAPDAFIGMGAGDSHACALLTAGTVRCWGLNSNGQAPASRSSTPAYRQVSVGGLHSCALRTDDVIECWGNNGNGQAPATKSALSGNYTSLDAGVLNTCALRSDGAIECWGQGYTGTAVQTAATGSFTDVAAGVGGCGLRSDGQIQCWGNIVGTYAPATGSYTAVTAGGNFGCGLRSDGAVQCWGSNAFGEAPSLKQAASGTYVQIGAGLSHACAVRSDGLVECWGWNEYAQAPALQSASKGRFVEVVAGTYLSCGRTVTGIGECWGWNAIGMLTVPQYRPAAPTELTLVVAANDEIRLSWADASTNETSFTLLRRSWDSGTDAWSGWTQLATVGPGWSRFFDLSAAAGNRYQYRVRACGLLGCSGWATSGAVHTQSVPAPLTALTTLPMAGGTIVLQWSDVDGERHYQLQRRAWDPVTRWGAWTALGRAVAGQTGWTDPGAMGGTFAYRIRACNFAGCSAWFATGPVAGGP